MTVKRFGPTLDAGVGIVEKEGEKSIDPSQLGSTAYVGLMERGPIGELITTVGKKDLLRKVGGLIPGALLPDCAQDFWDHSLGAGVLFLYRVTDGNEQAATWDFYNRAATKQSVVTIAAKNGGGWAGRRQTFVVDLTAVPGDITGETTIELPITFHPIYEDQFKGGVLTCSETSTSYEIVGNDESDGSAKTELRIAADSTLLTDYGAGTDEEFIIEVDQVDEWGREKHVAVEILDGQLNPSTEWGLKVYVDDELVKTWPDLNSDPLASNYFVNMINDDPSNHYITVTDNWVGAVTAATRPANFYGTIASADVATDITEKQLDLATVAILVSYDGSDASTCGSFTYGAKAIPDTYEVEYTGTPTDWTVVSTNRQAEHTFANAVAATPYVAENAWSIGFTVTEATPASGDKFTLTVIPLVEDEAIGGRLFFPDESWAPATGWQITDNDETTADITVGDLTNGGTISGDINFRLQYRQQLWDGYDGIAQVDETDFLPAFDTGGTSEFEKLAGKGYGLVKFACPGITELLTSSLTSIDKAQTVERAGVAFADAKNHQYRLEVPQTGTDEIVVRDYVQGVIGKSNYEKVCLHGYCKVSDPVLTDRMKTIPTTGMIHGWEARVAKNYNGYHKVAAGEDVKLTRIRELLTGDTVLNGELLNPAGIQRIEQKGGHFVLWGAKIPASETTWKFCQHRELMSYYEHVLIENFGWIIFAINDQAEEPALISAMQSFFRPEWVKRALRGDTFVDACQIKIDAEINTDATRAAGDENAEVTLRLADTIERFIITIGKAGAFESTAAA